MQEELTAFAKELAKDYSMDGFGEEAIRQHIKDCLHERRRQINHGYDYEKVNYILPIIMKTLLLGLYNCEYLLKDFGTRIVELIL